MLDNHIMVCSKSIEFVKVKEAFIGFCEIDNMFYVCIYNRLVSLFRGVKIMVLGFMETNDSVCARNKRR